MQGEKDLPIVNRLFTLVAKGFTLCIEQSVLCTLNRKKADLDEFGLTWKGMTKFTFSPTTEMSLVLRWRGRRIFGCSVWWERWERKSKSEWVVWKWYVDWTASTAFMLHLSEPQTRKQVMGLFHICCTMWFTGFSAGLPLLLLSNNNSVLCLKTHLLNLI